jgi:hypothetical protein
VWIHTGVCYQLPRLEHHSLLNDDKHSLNGIKSYLSGSNFSKYWVEVADGENHHHFGQNTDESIEMWHQRLGLMDT